MTQGKDFCLERNSCTEGIAQDSEQGNKGRIIAQKPIDFQH